MRCPACGESIPSTSRFCATCGARQARQSEERRIVTVLFADIVGFTSLSEHRDPEQVKHLVDRCFQWLTAEIVAFGGRVDKIVGDAILALFGAPIAHEDDAERAVRAALRMQEVFGERAEELGGEVRLRIGLNTGEVLVGALSAGGDYTAMGDVVNTASRLQTAAEPGEVLVGVSTYQATERVIPYRERGTVPAKGRESPVVAFTALPPTTAPGERPNRTSGPLVGRESEVEVLESVATSALAGERAVLLVLLGDAGMGKSRIAAEVAALLARRGDATVFEGRCVPYGEANPWWPLADALRSVLSTEMADPVEVIEPRLNDLVAEMLQRDRDDPEADRTAAGLLGLFGFGVLTDGLGPDRGREEVVRCFVRLFDEITRRRPAVLWLSDLQWADPVVDELLQTVLEALARRPLVVVATGRRSMLERWTPPIGRFDTFALNLEPLGDAAVDRLIDRLVAEDGGHRVPPVIRTELRARSGGNPLFLIELLGLLEDRGVGDEPESVLHSVPDTLRGLIAARLDALSPSERAVVDDAAVLGRRGKVLHLTDMAGNLRGIWDITADLDALANRDLIRVAGGIWEFTSDLTREVAYAMLTKSDRAAKHLGVARWIEADNGPTPGDRIVDVLAHHYGQAVLLLDDLGALDDLSAPDRARALRWIEAAGLRGEQMRRLSVVERLTSEGLILVGDTDREARLALVLRRARSRALARDAAGACADAIEAGALAETLEDVSAQAAVQLVEGEVAQQRGDLDTARTTFAAAAERYRQASDLDGEAEALRSLGMAELFGGRTVEAEVAIGAAKDAFSSLGRRSGEAWALQNLAWISFTRGRIAEAERRVEESLAVFEEVGDKAGAVWAQGLQGFIRFAQGDAEEAEALRKSVLAYARSGGDRWATAMMLLLGSVTHLWTGRTEEAIEFATEGLGVFGSVHDRLGQARIVWPLARALAMRGDLDAARSELDRAGHFTASPRQVGELLEGRANLAVARASVEVHAGQPEAALAALAALADDLGQAEVAAVFRAQAPQTGSTDWVGGALRVGAGLDLATSVATALLQALRVDEAAAVLETAADHVDAATSTTALDAALGLVRAAQGRRVDVETVATRVFAQENASYLDRAMVGIAAGLAAAAEGDEEASQIAFRKAEEAVGSTGDLLTRALVELAKSRSTRVLAGSEASAELSDEPVRIDDLGTDAHGWLAAIDHCLDRTAQGIEPV